MESSVSMRNKIEIYKKSVKYLPKGILSCKMVKVYKILEELS